MAYKRHIFLEGSRPFGAFIFYEDAERRPSFKFSIGPKIFDGDLWVQERETGVRKSFLSKTTPEMSCDASYKFNDHLLEFKSQRPGEEPDRLITEVSTPPQHTLFSVRLRNWQHIAPTEMREEDILLAPPWSCEEIVVFFSFAGIEGKPFMPNESLMERKEGRTITLDFPLLKPYDKMWIGIGEAVKNDAFPDLMMVGPNQRKLQ